MCEDCRNGEVRVAHSPWRSRLEAHVAGRRVGMLEYTVHGTWAVLSRTDIVDDAPGRAVAHRLAATALDLLRSRGYRILPVCPWVLAFLAAHPDEVEGIDEFPTGIDLPVQRGVERLPRSA